MKKTTSVYLCSLGHAANETYLRSRLSQAIRTEQDQTALTQLEERLPTFLQLESKSPCLYENKEKPLLKFNSIRNLTNRYAFLFPSLSLSVPSNENVDKFVIR